MSVYYEFDIEMFDLEYGDIQDHDFFGMFPLKSHFHISRSFLTFVPFWSKSI